MVMHFRNISEVYATQKRMKMNEELLEKYFKNNCSEEELKSILVWFKESATTPEGKALSEKIWDSLTAEDEKSQVDFDLLLNQIHHQVNLMQAIKITHNRKEKILRVLMRAAAIFMLPILGFGLYVSFRYQAVKDNQVMVNQAYNEVWSSLDAITKVTLPDGSHVCLNHNSSLKYPATFSGNTRIVELQGEGYFEVATNDNMPFVVKAGGIDVRALGTTFNVMAYPDEDNIETSLIEGKIELQKVEPHGKETLLLIMKPTDFAVFQKSSNELTLRTITDDRYFSWKDGKLVFNEEPMEEMVKKLSRWFNVEIEIEDPELNEFTYTATFIHETLPQVLNLLTLVSPISYTISNRVQISEGVFSKSKVVLSHKKE